LWQCAHDPAVKTVLKKIILQSIKRLGYELRRVDGPSTLTGVLRRARELGFQPAAVIDVGAADGQFAQTCAQVFSEPVYLLIEPLHEFAAALSGARLGISQCLVSNVAISSTGGEADINVHPDLVGSSLYKEEEGPETDGQERRVPVVPLDELVRQNALSAPSLLKIDVQGAELDILEGGQRTLDGAEFVILEVSFFRFFKDAPQFHDVIDYMKKRGFVVYGITGVVHRPLDGALSQADLVFVKEEGMFRHDHMYATPEQRQQQTRRLRKTIDKRMERS